MKKTQASDSILSGKAMVCPWYMDFKMKLDSEYGEEDKISSDKWFIFDTKNENISKVHAHDVPESGFLSRGKWKVKSRIGNWEGYKNRGRAPFS